MSRRRPVRRPGLAQGHDLDDTTVVFMINPSGARTMQEVLELLRLVSVNPVHEQVMRDAGWLSNTATWPTSAYPEAAFLPPNPRMLSNWEARGTN